LGDCFSNDVGIHFRAADLQNIDLYILLAGQFLQLFLDAVYLVTTFTYNDTRFGSMDGNDQLTQRPFNHYAGNAPFIDTVIQVSPDLVIFDQFGSIIFLAAIPIRVPSSDDT